MTRLTIEVDPELFARAKELAAASKVTVEEVIERLLRVVAQPPLKSEEMPPNLRRAMGMAPPMTDEEVRQTIEEERSRKYRG
jgi:hypothetical protein